MTLGFRSPQAVDRALRKQARCSQSCPSRVSLAFIGSQGPTSLGKRLNSQLSGPDRVNPPLSTLPPPLGLPERGDAAFATYLFKLGRAYGKFYWAGTKAVWSNHKAIRPLRKQISNDAKDLPRRLISPHIQDQCELAVKGSKISRAEFQAIMRDVHDVGKLPLFGLLVAAFGEWLPLLVPFMPGVVPMTCRIPKQIEDMRKALEMRRRAAFRQGILAPSEDKLFKVEEHTSTDQDKRERATGKAMEAENGEASPICSLPFARDLTSQLEGQQLMHISSSLGLHRSLWDRVGISPPQSLLRWAIERRIQYLGLDDTLLIRDRGLSKLRDAEVVIACEDRGVDVTNRKIEDLKKDLGRWMERRTEDGGNGRRLLEMLFKRPNSWA